MDNRTLVFVVRGAYATYGVAGILLSLGGLLLLGWQCPAIASSSTVTSLTRLVGMSIAQQLMGSIGDDFLSVLCFATGGLLLMPCMESGDWRAHIFVTGTSLSLSNILTTRVMMGTEVERALCYLVYLQVMSHIDPVRLVHTGAMVVLAHGDGVGGGGN